MVTKESHELLQRELKATKEAFENYKKENNKKLLELMKEIDEERKLGVQSNVEIARIRKLAEEQWVGK
ncbi:hypothetical protein EB796_023818 [Bugula neritina]|uniref:Uncharacterized protein n=1 Tax=Bugula neritina TaxID=10212 RepID=A0A7J7IVE9_BUGNE|nr:hypothetical protein EB796_023818 [Bugula neritina]